MTYRILFHTSVADDLDWIAEWISDYAGVSSAAAKLDETEATIRSLTLTPHKGGRRDEIAQGLRAVPADGRAPFSSRLMMIFGKFSSTP